MLDVHSLVCALFFGDRAIGFNSKGAIKVRASSQHCVCAVLGQHGAFLFCVDSNRSGDRFLTRFRLGQAPIR